MRVFSLPATHFMRVAYVSDSLLLSADYAGGHHVRLWDLASDAEPQLLDWPQARTAWPLFQPHAGHFLRRQGRWPDGATLPPAFEGSRKDGDPLIAPNDWLARAFGPDGETVVYCETVITRGFYSARFHLRRPAGAILELFHALCIFASPAAISPDGRLVAMSGGDRIVTVREVTGKEVARLEQTDGVGQLVFTDDKLLAISAGRTTRVWDVTTSRPVYKLPAFRKHAEALVTSSDRRLLAVAGREGIVLLCDAKTGSEVARYDWKMGRVNGLAFAPDDRTVAAATDSGIVVWDAD